MSALRLLAVSFLALLPGCSSIDVSVDFDPEADFSGLATFDFLPAPEGQRDPRLENDLLDGRIRRSVEAELTAKGFARVAGTEPDFWVAYHVGVESKLDVTTLHNSYPYYGRYRGPVGGYSETVTREYEQGTLLLDMVDPARETMIWRGSGKVIVEDHKTPEKREKRVREVVERILRDFPPS